MAGLDPTMVEFVIDADQSNQKDNEYLHSSDNKFNDSFDNFDRQSSYIYS